MVRFLHTADLHLGSPLETVADQSRSVQKQLQQATYTALERIVETALSENVDFVLFAGDVYDQESRSVRANSFFVQQLERLDEKDIPAYIIYGNHDPLGQGEELLDLPPSTTVFGSEEPETAHFPDVQNPQARILGQSYRNPSESRKMYHEFSPPDDDVPNIGMLHTGLDPESSRYVPCSLSDLRSREEIQYWALGHIHRRKVYTGTVTAAYPGIPQGREITESGPGGCFLVELENGQQPELTFVPVGPIVWLQSDVPVDGEKPDASPGNVEDVIRMIEEKGQNILDQNADQLAETDPDISVHSPYDLNGFVLRWELTGRGEINELLRSTEDVESGIAEQLRRNLGEGSPFLWTESVRVRTADPLPPVEDLREKDRVLQELFSLFEELEDRDEWQNELRDACKDIWTEPGDHEETDFERFPLRDDVFQTLVEDARNLLVDRIRKKRSEHVDS